MLWKTKKRDKLCNWCYAQIRSSCASFAIHAATATAQLKVGRKAASELNISHGFYCSSLLDEEEKNRSGFPERKAFFASSRREIKVAVLTFEMRAGKSVLFQLLLLAEFTSQYFSSSFFANFPRILLPTYTRCICGPIWQLRCERLFFRGWTKKLGQDGGDDNVACDNCMLLLTVCLSLIWCSVRICRKKCSKIGPFSVVRRGSQVWCFFPRGSVLYIPSDPNSDPLHNY
jgi:hypothetical protein